MGKQLKQLGMLVIQDQAWNRVTVNRAAGKITQNVKDLLASREVEDIFENSDVLCMLNQAPATGKSWRNS